MDEVLTSYRDTGEFDPQRWLIVQHEDRDVGCLLLADHPAADQWELVYMGLMAEARGRGFGLPLVQYAQWLTRLADRPRLVVAVDGANGPAMSVYDSAGFVSWDQRVVFWRKFDAS